MAKLPYTQQLVVAVDDRERPDPATACILLTDDLRMTDAEIVLARSSMKIAEGLFA